MLGFLLNVLCFAGCFVGGWFCHAKFGTTVKGWFSKNG